MEIEFKQGFIERYSKLTDWETFRQTSIRFLRRSIRVNTLKTTTPKLKRDLADWTLTQIPWCREGFWIEHKEGRRDIGNAIPHMLGHFYIQEAASMIPPIVLDPKAGELVLDMCASPGSKTTQIAALMNNSGVLISNDYKGDRLAALGINSQKQGLTNQIITLTKGEQLTGKFDKILVDAPCSGTGTIRKSLKTLRIWNPNMIRRLSITQKNLLEKAVSLVKPGGTIVYSTCSLEPEEDEGVIDFITTKLNLKTEKISLPGLRSSPPIEEFEGKKYNPQVRNCLRLWPQDNDTEGFFVAKIIRD